MTTFMSPRLSQAAGDTGNQFVCPPPMKQLERPARSGRCKEQPILPRNWLRRVRTDCGWYCRRHTGCRSARLAR